MYTASDDKKNSYPDVPKQGNHNLTPRLYIVHYHEDTLYGYEWTETPVWMEAKKYPVKFDLRGKLAHFVIVSNDLAVTRLDAISFCAAIVGGKVKIFNCDLSSIQPVWKES